ncbi:MAG TPA: NAD-dependent protein deacylase [Kofleriaceae bacterium]|nr:NAD-dependent protein deacylase [Kofleriaceae bacterium]
MIEVELAARAAALVAGARRVLVITGAGISADAGLPTYRGIGGLYEGAVTDEGMPIEVALSGATMDRDPALCWKYIAAVERACRGARPSRGHQVLAELERRLPHLCVLTQNVDGLHRAAGSQNVIEIHGTVHQLRCDRCLRRRQVDDYTGLDIPPRCACGHVERPDVVLFGEMLPWPEVRRLEAELDAEPDLVISIGTTSVFPYIAGPVEDAARRGTPTIEINPGDSEVSHVVAVRLRTSAAEALDAIARALAM